jgi:hypothetical protein
VSNTNAVTPFNEPTLKELADSLGITQFTTETNWFQTIGGVLIQGGSIAGVSSGATVVVPFNVGFPTQVLGVFAQVRGTSVLGWSVTAVDIEKFSIVNAVGAVRDFYWWAIGV